MVRRITIQDIANIAGVSKSTVSRAMNDNPVISKTTRNQIQQIIKEYNYHPNSSAKSIKTKQTMVIGIIIPSFDNPFFAKILDVIQNKATNKQYQLMIATTHEKGELELNAIRQMINQPVDGLIVVSTGKINDYHQLLNNTPVVFIDRIANQRENHEFDTILVDNINGSFNVVNQMIENGAERIGIIANSLFKKKSNRLIGYQKALQKNNVELDPDIILYCSRNGRDAISLASQLLINQACDGIFATDSNILKSVLKQIEVHQMDNVQVGAFDDNPYLSLLNLNVIANQQPSNAMGSKAFELLMDQIHNPQHDVQHIKLKTSLKHYH
ncbi:LacI family DNA-binding transcriptional regulator [Nicoliella lavandulae]|uniref:LacI family DNA-binding transcriptional regulator n=1 Tax=Nicoliella lavandulae TaxID=3082954 RepID=A0ABU8SLF2_9LACO